MKACNFILVIGALFLLCGCSSTHVRGTVVTKKFASYGVEPLPPSWQKQNFRGAELFFAHPDGAYIFINSQCDRVSDSPLEALTSQMLVDMGKYEIVSQARVDLGGREALVSEVSLSLDGVRRYVKIMVLRKNRCVFDAVFNSREFSPELVKDFDVMVSSFWAEAEL